VNEEFQKVGLGLKKGKLPACVQQQAGDKCGNASGGREVPEMHQGGPALLNFRYGRPVPNRPLQQPAAALDHSGAGLRSLTASSDWLAGSQYAASQLSTVPTHGGAQFAPHSSLSWAGWIPLLARRRHKSSWPRIDTVQSLRFGWRLLKHAKSPKQIIIAVDGIVVV